MSELNVRMFQHRYSQSDWESKNPILENGELGICDNDDGSISIKCGDGYTSWTNLPLMSGGKQQKKNIDIQKMSSMEFIDFIEKCKQEHSLKKYFNIGDKYYIKRAISYEITSDYDLDVSFKDNSVMKYYLYLYGFEDRTFTIIDDDDKYIAFSDNRVVANGINYERTESFSTKGIFTINSSSSIYIGKTFKVHINYIEEQLDVAYIGNYTPHLYSPYNEYSTRAVITSNTFEIGEEIIVFEWHNTTNEEVAFSDLDNFLNNDDGFRNGLDPIILFSAYKVHVNSQLSFNRDESENIFIADCYRMEGSNLNFQKIPIKYVKYTNNGEKTDYLFGTSRYTIDGEYCTKVVDSNGNVTFVPIENLSVRISPMIMI